MAYDNDKRIRELTDLGAPSGTDFLALDRNGMTEARRITLGDVAQYLSPLVGKQVATKGVGNPDNAVGANGDFYYKIPANNSSIQLFQKVGSVWQSIFLFTVPTGVAKGKVEGDQSTGGMAAGAFPVPFLNTESIWTANYTTVNGTYWIEPSMLQDGSLYGFPDGENFTFKINYI